MTAGDEITRWSELLSAITLGAIKDPLSASFLRDQFGFQIAFILLTGKARNPSYFKGIPFTRIGQGAVEKARGYVDHPPIPVLLAVFGASLPPDRYVVQQGKDPQKVTIGRRDSGQIDTLIATTAECLSGVLRYRTINANDRLELAAAAYTVIRHYADIPVVCYFCSLPYLESAIGSRELSPVDFLITVYKGIEGLFLEMWEEIGEGEVITDNALTRKARQLLTH